MNRPLLNSGRRSTRIALRLAGAALVVIALQMLVYEHSVERLIESSEQQLTSLRVEVADNRELDAGLRALQEAWKASGDEALRREFVALRDRVGETFFLDREAAVADFVSTVQRLDLAGGQREFAALARQAERIAGIYGNRSEEALLYLQRPPLLLQPTAAFLGRNQLSRIRFNKALHALLVDDVEGARDILTELRAVATEPGERARIDYALGRLHYERSRGAEPAADGIGQALTMLRDSLRNAPGEELPELLLDFLLAIEDGASLVEMEDVQSQGAGRGEGERGALPDDSGEF